MAHSDAAHVPAVRAAPMAALALLAVTLFLLTADLVHVTWSGAKIKYGYFAVLSLWLTAPRAMLGSGLAGLRAAPRWPLVLLLPLAVTVATSHDVRASVAWTLWLAFDLFTVLTVYAFLTANRFRTRQVAAAAAAALALVALGGLAQFAAIHGFGRVILSPQQHLDVYRINGLAGWPHFLCIFAFLLLPLVATQERLSPAVKVALAALVFVLVQSTAKTGWLLFLALASLMLWFDRATFTRQFLGFLLPATIAVLLLPLPSPPPSVAPAAGSAAATGSAKIHAFAQDLDVTRGTTSGADRLLINSMGLAVFAQHPWFGVGPRAYGAYVTTRFDAELPGVNKRDANGTVNTRNENIWIEALAEGGLFLTLGLAVLLVSTLRVPGFAFRNRLHFGAFVALVLYFGLSGQVSQTGLLTLAYAVLGVFLYARNQRPVAKSEIFMRSRMSVPFDARGPLSASTRPHS